MAVISGILKDPIGGPRVGVVIELRAIRTSATVVNQARSQSITDAAGKYTLTVEPGAYDVMITAGGRQPERVGGITVALNSQNGTLNDFLTMPGEADLTPEIVATVDRMRAEAANSAAAAKTSETNAKASSDNAAAVLANTFTKTQLSNLNFSPTEATANAVWRKVGTVKNMVQGGQTIVIRIGGTASYNGHPNANGLLDIVIRTGSGSVTGVNTVGRASATAFITNGIGFVGSTQLISDLGLIETAANTFDLYLKFNPFVSGISAAISATSISHIADNWTWGKTEVADPTIVLEREIIKVWTEASLPNPLKVGDYGFGSYMPVILDATTINDAGVNRFFRVPQNTANAPSIAAQAGLMAGYDSGSRFQMTWEQGVLNPSVATRVRNATTNAWGPWVTFWHTGNLPTPLKAGDYGLGGGPLHQDDTKQTIGRIYRVTTSSLNKPTAEPLYGVLSLPMDGTPSVGYVFVSATGKLRTGLSGASGNLTSYNIWGDYNTTVDANGNIKKASPIVKLFGTGECELNEHSQGVTTERISEGVYRVSGVLGFNSDGAWGGPNGGIGLPKDNNDLALVWVDYEVDESGDLLIKTFHRINSTAPKFAQNIVAGYKEGQPIDIPAGRWIDLRVEMPAGDEPEPIPEPDAVPDTDQQPEAETEQPAELEQGDTPEAETKE
ncbi:MULTISPECIES: phage tail fiber protein [unclassified Serratia (in: enterobacteria)]|uniref:phage tail fiber protein n=1 Tax=unclassified Serratia (in: enterobacteria) TaxID=2647522 RepID=UPI0030766F50